VPSPICQSTKAEKAFSSSAPSANGVMSAVREPLSISEFSLDRSDRNRLRTGPEMGELSNCGHIPFIAGPQSRSIDFLNERDKQERNRAIHRSAGRGNRLFTLIG